MTGWTNEELNRIGSAEEIRIAALQPDGTLNKPVTIWVVRVGDNLYVRSYRGQKGRWFRTTQVRDEGKVWASGVEKDVTFVGEVSPEIKDQIDQAYRSKYGHDSAYVPPMLTDEVRSTTLRLVPR
jgi:hypothetical protein